jgi:hypothetical protein
MFCGSCVDPIDPTATPGRNRYPTIEEPLHVDELPTMAVTRNAPRQATAPLAPVGWLSEQLLPSAKQSRNASSSLWGELFSAKNESAEIRFAAKHEQEEAVQDGNNGECDPYLAKFQKGLARPLNKRLVVAVAAILLGLFVTIGVILGATRHHMPVPSPSPACPQLLQCPAVYATNNGPLHLSNESVEVDAVFSALLPDTFMNALPPHCREFNYTWSFWT